MKLDLTRSGKKVVVLSVIWCVGSIAFFTRRTPLLQLLSVPLFVLFLTAIIASFQCVFVEWRQRRWRSLFPLAVCVIAFFLSVVLVLTTKHCLFVWALPSYEAIVRQMEAGSIPVTTEIASFPQAEKTARLAYAVFAKRDTNGVLTVEFITEGGFPVKHSGYLYSSSGVIERGSITDSHWPIRQEMRPKWFYISD